MPVAYSQDTYHLPAGYNDSRIVLLARDPHCIFAFWEVSGDTRSHFIEEFGSELWDKSTPVLKVTNVSKNSSFHIRVNDFATNWYIRVEDSDSLYFAELGRMVSGRFFINIASSNYIATPSENVSSNTTAYFADYRDFTKGRLDLEGCRIYENCGSGQDSKGLIGLSSAELFGISSAELLRAGHPEINPEESINAEKG
ncbi:MAG: DUF4912 domain-containing protein [Clostridiales bacterium]|nr:DUF4912 domain-containing protein [Eubacteriales bacterium]MDH7565677.1 DUF4912 domain-containing protein [Clostridiales bacterium]